MRARALLTHLFVSLLWCQPDHRACAAEAADAQAFLQAAQRYADTISGSSAADAWQQYTHELRGTRVARWEGAIARIEDGARAKIWLHMGPQGAAAPRPPRVVVYTRSRRLLGGLREGQRVRVSGTVAEVYKDGEVKVAIDNASLEAPDGTPLPDEPTAAAERPAGLRITLERTACFGACPVYEVSVDGDGNVTWSGQSDVSARGRRSARVPRAAVQRLLERLERGGFFTMHDYNRRMVTDHPSAIITVVREGQTKRVVHYLGDHTAPPRLAELEKDLDNTLRTRGWIGEGKRRSPRRSVLHVPRE